MHSVLTPKPMNLGQAAGNLAATQKQEREPAMQSAMQMQSIALIDLENMVSSLYERLHHVLRKGEVAATPQDSQSNPSTPPLVAAVMDNTSRVNAATVGLKQLLDNLEI